MNKEAEYLSRREFLKSGAVGLGVWQAERFRPNSTPNACTYGSNAYGADVYGGDCGDLSAVTLNSASADSKLSSWQLVAFALALLASLRLWLVNRRQPKRSDR